MAKIGSSWREVIARHELSEEDEISFRSFVSDAMAPDKTAVLVDPPLGLLETFYQSWYEGEVWKASHSLSELEKSFRTGEPLPPPSDRWLYLMDKGYREKNPLVVRDDS